MAATSRLWPRVNRSLAWFHRWAGVVLCVLFVVWFASGAVLHFVGFPSLPMSDRLAGSDVIDLARLRVDPSSALAQAANAEDLRLVSAEGRPVYLATSGTHLTAIAGDTGRVLEERSAASARNIAERFARTSTARVDGAFDYDQWTVHQQFDRYRPLFRVRLNDVDDTDLYVSARTGEVVQRTRGTERAWNWCGAVLHWIYFTPVRKDWSVWNQLVWWISLAALLTSVVGTWLGIVRLAAVRATRRPTWSPFRGWLRWHHLIGLFASIVVLSWIFSGWLSMDHGRLFSRGEVMPAQASRMRGMPLSAIARVSSLDRLRAAGPATEIILSAVAGRPFLAARGGSSNVTESRIVWLDTGAVAPAPLPQEVLLAGLRAVWPHVIVATQRSGSDTMYRLAESVSPDALAVQVTGVGPTRVYVDRVTGRLLVVMDRSRRAYAWVYYCLHTLHFPALSAHPGLRTVVVLLLLALGLAFSTTGIVLGVKRMKLQMHRVDSTAGRVPRSAKAWRNPL